MAKTRQTAKQSSGGKAPRKQIADIAARRYYQARTDFQEAWKVMSVRWDYVARFGRSEEVRYLAQDFEKVFGKHVKWVLDERPVGTKTTNKQCYELGLTESVNDVNAYNQDVTDDDCLISKVWLSDGSADDEHDGCMYGLDDETGNKHLILLYTLRYAGEPAREESQVDDQDRFWLGKETRVTHYLRIYRWCSRNKNRRMLLKFPGSRGESSIARRFHDKQGSIRHFRSSTKCLFASMANAMLVAIGEEYARTWWDAVQRGDDDELKNEDKLPRQFRGLQDLGKRVDKSLIALEWVRDENNEKMVPSPSWLTSSKQGIFLVALKSLNGSLHCICIWCSKRLILDSVEEFPMKLTLESIFACVGDKNEFNEVAEVRKFVKKREVDERRGHGRRNAGEYDILGNQIAESHRRPRKRRKRSNQ